MDSEIRKALIIVDHGSTRAEANAMLECVAGMIQTMSPDVPIHYAHMELAEPSIEQAFEKCVADGANVIIVHPYMLSPGRHAMSDIPRLVKEAAAKHPDVQYCVTEPLGIDPKIGEVVLERAGIRPKVRAQPSVPQA